MPEASLHLFGRLSSPATSGGTGRRPTCVRISGVIGITRSFRTLLRGLHSSTFGVQGSPLS
eukprot:2524316-Alexandrium_andersonii.AAC.1